MRRFLLAAGAAVLWTGAAHAQQAGDAIRPLVVVAQPEAAAPQEYQAAELAVQAWKQLGLDIRVQPLTSQQYSQVVWYERQKWDATTWQMVGRPERSDPDELTYNLFFSGNAANGYDFVNYINPEYDRLAQAQRQELDLDKRRALIQEAQQLINRDQPYAFIVDPKNLTAFNANVWDEKSVVSQQGIGIRNFWTWISLTPKTRAEGRDPEFHRRAHESQPVQHPRRPGFLGHRTGVGPADAHRPGRIAETLGGLRRDAADADRGGCHLARRHEMVGRHAGDSR